MISRRGLPIQLVTGIYFVLAALFVLLLSPAASNAQSEAVIRAALNAEMSLLKSMGVNAIRQYSGVQPTWVQYIYEKYGIYTMLNHSFGRYGVTLDDAYIANTEYSDPRVREYLLSEVRAMVEEFKDVPGVLMYLLGNDNNYGLF